MKRLRSRAQVRVWLAAGVIVFAAPLTLAAQQSADADPRAAGAGALRDAAGRGGAARDGAAPAERDAVAAEPRPAPLSGGAFRRARRRGSVRASRTSTSAACRWTRAPTASRQLTTRGSGAIEVVNAESGAKVRVDIPTGATASVARVVAGRGAGRLPRELRRRDVRVRRRCPDGRIAPRHRPRGAARAGDDARLGAGWQRGVRRAGARAAHGDAERAGGGRGAAGAHDDRGHEEQDADVREPARARRSSKAQLEYYATGQLARIDVRSGGGARDRRAGDDRELWTCRPTGSYSA